MSITTELPAWFILFCILLGASYAALLYYRERRNEFNTSLKYVLAGIRFIAVTGLAFLLLSPLLHSNKRITEEPVVVIAHDNSQSVAGAGDSAGMAGYLKRLNDLREELSSEFDVREYTFGQTVKSGLNLDFADQTTDISRMIEEIRTRFVNTHLGAVILASDGIYNRGLHPVSAATETGAPVITIALGDTTVRRDLILEKINYNRVAYLNNEFPVEIVVRARKASGYSSRLIIQKDGSELASRPVEISSDDQFITFTENIRATQPGIQSYSISLKAIPREITLQNNRSEIFIDVLDSRQKILILANSPHPDVTTLNQAILSNQNYEVDVFLASEFKGSPDAYNLVVFHQLPSVRFGTPVVEANQEVPALYILGPQTHLNAFNEQYPGLSISSESVDFNEALPEFNERFTLFNPGSGFREFVSYMPPLTCPFGDYEISPVMETLLYQQIGRVTTGYPLLTFSHAGSIRTGVLAGTGIWRWRLAAFSNEGTHETFDRLINKVVQYLSVREDKSLFRVYPSKNSYYDNEIIEFEAELYSEAYEPVTGPEVTLVITSDDGKKYPFTFAASGSEYYLNAGSLPSGSYTFSARVEYGGKIFTAKGEFSVTGLNIEKHNMQADHHILFNLAGMTGGEMVYPSGMDGIPQILGQMEGMKPLVFEQSRYMEVINFPWILVILIALLSMEWFLRRRAGSY